MTIRARRGQILQDALETEPRDLGGAYSWGLCPNPPHVRPAPQTPC